MNTNKQLLVGLALLFFIAAGTAYAASSLQFFSQAQKYVNHNCGKRGLSDQTALWCYLFSKSEEQEQSIATMAATLSPIPSQIGDLGNRVRTLEHGSGQGKQLQLYDAANQKLGIVVDGAQFSQSRTIFNEQLGKILSIDSDGTMSSRVPTYYLTDNCSGPAYYYYNENVEYFLSIGRGQYAIVDPSAAPSSQVIGSYYNVVFAYCTSMNQTIANLSPLSLQPYPYQNLTLPLRMKWQ